MIVLKCDQCGTERNAREAWFFVCEPQSVRYVLFRDPEEPIAHLCSLDCLRKWAGREELRRRHAAPVAIG